MYNDEDSLAAAYNFRNIILGLPGRNLYQDLDPEPEPVAVDALQDDVPAVLAPIDAVQDDVAVAVNTILEQEPGSVDAVSDAAAAAATKDDAITSDNVVSEVVDKVMKQHFQEVEPNVNLSETLKEVRKVKRRRRTLRYPSLVDRGEEKVVKYTYYEHEKRCPRCLEDARGEEGSIGRRFKRIPWGLRELVRDAIAAKVAKVEGSDAAREVAVSTGTDVIHAWMDEEVQMKPRRTIKRGSSDRPDFVMRYRHLNYEWLPDVVIQ